MRVKHGLATVRWVTIEDARRDYFMANSKEELVRIIMGIGDMVRYDNEKRERERKRRERIC